MRPGTMAAGAALLTMLWGCAEPAPQTAAFEDSGQIRATVQTVDRTTRQVLLRTEDDRLLTVTAGPEVRNFAQIEPGDEVVAAFAESITARMAAPDEVAVTRTGVAGERAPVGARPGAAAGVSIQSIVEWVSYDPRSAIATFTGPTGIIHSVVVPEDMRAFAAARRAGDRVAVDYTTAVAVGIEEVAG